MANLPDHTTAQRLTRLLDAKGVSQSEAADMAGIPRQALWKLVSGETRDPRIATVERIVEAIGATMTEFYDDSAVVDHE